MTFRVISFTCMLLCALFLPLWVFAVMTLAYTFMFGPYELLILAVCIDAAYGTSGVGVWYAHTLTVSVATAISLCLKPYVRFHT